MTRKTKDTTPANEYLKRFGLKNPPLDSGVSGGGDAPRKYASMVMQEFADQELLSLQDENKRLREVLKQIEKSCDNTNDSHEQIWRIALAGLNPKEDENP